jgi:hypothetical protein
MDMTRFPTVACRSELIMAFRAMAPEPKASPGQSCDDGGSVGCMTASISTQRAVPRDCVVGHCCRRCTLRRQSGTTDLAVPHYHLFLTVGHHCGEQRPFVGSLLMILILGDPTSRSALKNKQAT